MTLRLRLSYDLTITWPMYLRPMKSSHLMATIDQLSYLRVYNSTMNELGLAFAIHGAIFNTSGCYVSTQEVSMETTLHGARTYGWGCTMWGTIVQHLAASASTTRHSHKTWQFGMCTWTHMSHLKCLGYFVGGIPCQSRCS
jgi:hypothetical protein